MNPTCFAVGVNQAHTFMFELVGNQIKYIGLVAFQYPYHIGLRPMFHRSEIDMTSKLPGFSPFVGEILTSKIIKKRYPKEYKKAFKLVINDVHLKSKENLHIFTIKQTNK